MVKRTYRYYNLKPKEFITPEFFTICAESINAMDRLRSAKENEQLDKLYSNIARFNKQQDQENRRKSLLFHFYINNCVDIQSILKTIVLLTECHHIEAVKSNAFNPSEVSLDSILNHQEVTSFLYKIATDKCEEKEFYLRITPQETSFTKVSIKALPYQLVLAQKMLYYLGGYMSVHIKKECAKFKMFEGYQGVKFSQQGRWKFNFTKKQLTSNSIIQKKQFFQDIVPISNKDVLLMIKKPLSESHLTFCESFVKKYINEQYAEYIKSCIEIEEFEEKEDLKKSLDKNMSRRNKFTENTTIEDIDKI